MNTTTFLMQTHTGSVDTAAAWLADMPTWEVYTPEGGYFDTPAQAQAERQRQYDALVEVKKVDGFWEGV
jgi:hypothetical protein